MSDVQVDEKIAAEVGEEAQEETQEQEIVSVSIGEKKEEETDEPAENENESSVIRRLRALHRDEVKKNRELERTLREERAKINAAGEKKTELRPRPTFEKSGYDEQKYEQDLEAWKEEERIYKKKQQEEEDERKKIDDDWMKEQAAYNEARTRTGFVDFEDAEQSVRDLLTPTQQGILVHVAKKPELLVYALGKDDAELKRIAAIKDPLRLSAELREIEGKIKVDRKPAVKPEAKVTSNSGVTGYDAKLEKLIEEAARTHDSTKLQAYRASLRKKG